MKRALVLLLIVKIIALTLGCKEIQNDSTEKIIEEIQKKETELDMITTSILMTQKQSELETNEEETFLRLPPKDNLVSQNDTNIQEEKTVTDTILQTPIGSFTNKDTNKYKNTPENNYKLKEPKAKAHIKTVKKNISKPRETIKKHRIYFSYRNGMKYISKNYPCKITTVVNPNKNVWYVDYNVYAIPAKYIESYKKYLVNNHLIGIGRNISVYNSQSQLTIYWTGKNLSKIKLPNGKYIIISSIFMKDRKKRIIEKSTGVLGGENRPIIAILKN